MGTELGGKLTPQQCLTCARFARALMLDDNITHNDPEQAVDQMTKYLRATHAWGKMYVPYIQTTFGLSGDAVDLVWDYATTIAEGCFRDDDKNLDPQGNINLAGGFENWGLETAVNFLVDEGAIQGRPE